jgi:hypothetical protein
MKQRFLTLPELYDSVMDVSLCTMCSYIHVTALTCVEGSCGRGSFQAVATTDVTPEVDALALCRLE